MRWTKSVPTTIAAMIATQCQTSPVTKVMMIATITADAAMPGAFIAHAPATETGEIQKPFAKVLEDDES